MRRLRWALIGFMGIVVVTGGCADRTTARGTAVVIPITDVKMVAGTWTGVASRQSSSRDDWLEVRVNEDGTFETASARQIGAVSGKGTVTVSDGKMKAVGPRGTAVLTLYDRQGRMLVMDFLDTNGVPYSAELRPKK